MRIFFFVKKKKKKKKKQACEIWQMAVCKIASNLLTEMRTELELKKKRNLEYFQVKDQLQEEYME